MTVRDLLPNDEKQALFIKLFEAHIKKCERLANAPSKGYGSANEELTREKWQNEADLTQEILDDFLIEMT